MDGSVLCSEIELSYFGIFIPYMCAQVTQIVGFALDKTFNLCLHHIRISANAPSNLTFLPRNLSPWGAFFLSSPALPLAGFF